MATREIVTTSRQRLQHLESEADATLQQLSALPRSSVWRRFWHRREAKIRKTLNDKLTKQLASVQRAAREHASSQNSLDAEIKSFRVARAKHEVDNERRIENARKALLIAGTAKNFVRNNPHFATWGSPRVLQMATQIERIRSERSSEDYEAASEANFLLPG